MDRPSVELNGATTILRYPNGDELRMLDPSGSMSGPTPTAKDIANIMKFLDSYKHAKLELKLVDL